MKEYMKSLKKGEKRSFLLMRTAAAAAWSHAAKKRFRYEYKCPHCGYVNVRYERTAKIVCDKCHRTFYSW